MGNDIYTKDFIKKISPSIKDIESIYTYAIQHKQMNKHLGFYRLRDSKTFLNGNDPKNIKLISDREILVLKNIEENIKNGTDNDIYNFLRNIYSVYKLNTDIVKNLNNDGLLKQFSAILSANVDQNIEKIISGSEEGVSYKYDIIDDMIILYQADIDNLKKYFYPKGNNNMYLSESSIEFLEVIY